MLGDFKTNTKPKDIKERGQVEEVTHIRDVLLKDHEFYGTYLYINFLHRYMWSRLAVFLVHFIVFSVIPVIVRCNKKHSHSILATLRCAHDHECMTVRDMLVLMQAQWPKRLQSKDEDALTSDHAASTLHMLYGA